MKGQPATVKIRDGIKKKVLGEIRRDYIGSKKISNIGLTSLFGFFPKMLENSR